MPVEWPILVVHSQADDIVPVHLSASLADRLCAAGQPLERVVLDEGAGHFAATGPAYAVAFDWLESRFDDRPFRSTCL